MDFNALMAKKLGGKFSVPEKEMTVNGKVTNWMERGDKKRNQPHMLENSWRLQRGKETEKL